MNKKFYIITKSVKKIRLKNWIKYNFVPYELSENFSEELNADILINNGWMYSESFDEVIILTPEAEDILREIKYGGIAPERLTNFYYWNQLINFFNF